MNKSDLFYPTMIVLIIILAGGAYFLNRVNMTQSVKTPSSQVTASVTEPNPTSQSLTTITYNTNGFAPMTVTIKKGETVQWINKSNNPMWIASDPHPTHTDYPGFDQLSNAITGDSYTFTFEKIGSWGYHNHKNPNDIGRVIVQ